MIEHNLSIEPIQALQDNYIWAIRYGNEAILVDPGESKPAKDWLSHHKINLTAILVTHHHHDHTGGIEQLTHDFPCQVYGPKSIPLVDHPCKAGETLQFWNNTLCFNIMATPGHTLDHIAYFNDTSIFCGDTLFSGGCGRLFEGTYEQMLNSINLINNLPDEIKIYPAHEYTKANLDFASQVEPHNKTIASYRKKIQNMACTLPTSLKIERTINPFLRLGSIQYLVFCESDLDKFRYLRKSKDLF